MTLKEDCMKNFRGSALASIVPGSLAAAAVVTFVKDKNTLNWWKSLKQPKWAPTDVFLLSAVDLAVMSPLGCASYLVYKYGGGFDYNDTKLALGMYGFNLACMTSIIFVTKKKNLKWAFWNSAALSLSAATMTALFGQIHGLAGKLVVPYTLWMAFYTVLTYSVWQENSPKVD